MAGLIKKQILKHLSRFAKNLSPDKINLSTLKGEGQLTNLELDEEVLQNMLDLPTWLAINRVFCNKATIRIPWTKLKTHPISLYLDKVVMEMSTCEDPRKPNGPSPIATASGQSEYGFAEKVVEGITISVNSIVIRIKAKAFNASFELSQLKVYSVNTSWQPGDLRFTRIHDPQRGEILTFKEISWQMIRIEADAIQSGDHEILSAPVRLITNQSKIRVTLKRRSAAPGLSSQQVRTPQSAAAADHNDTIAKLFNSYDVLETSHHLQITHLDLHICDDIHAKDRGVNKQITGGAMQLSFNEITVDYYPFHRAGETCQHWMHFSEATKSREGWAKNILVEFKALVDMLKHAVKDHRNTTAAPPSSPPQGAPQQASTRKISTSSTSSFTASSKQPKTHLMSSSIVVRVTDFNFYQVSTADQCRSSPKTMISCNKKALYLPQEMPATHIEFTEYYFPDGKDYPIPCPNLYVQLNALQLVLDARSMVWLNQFVLDLRQSLEQFMALYKLDDSAKTDEHVDIRVDGLMLKLIVPTQKELERHQDLPQSISIQTSEMIATNTRHSAKCTRSDLEAVLQDFKEFEFFSKTFTDFPKSEDSFNLLHPIFQRHAHEQDTKMHDIYKGFVTPILSTNALKVSAATDVWAVHFSQFWIDYEGMKSGKGRPVPFVDSFPFSIWFCQPAKYTQSQQRFQTCKAPAFNIPKSESAELSDRMHRKKLLKDYYSTDCESITNGIKKPASLDSIPVSSPSPPSSSLNPDIQILVHVQKHLSMQVNHYQYIFLMCLQNSIRILQQNIQKDMEEVTGKHSEQTNICVGLLLKSAEVALLLHPIPQTDTRTKSPVSYVVSQIDSDISPSESRGHLEQGSELLNENVCRTSDCIEDATVAHLDDVSSVDDLLCKPFGELTMHKSMPLQPSAASSFKSSFERENCTGTVVERTGSADCDSSELLCNLSATDHLAVSENNGEGLGSFEYCKEVTQNEFSSTLNSRRNGGGDPLSDQRASKPKADLLSRDLNGGKEKPHVTRMSQSISSGKLIKERSQSSFSVSYKNVKRSPSLHSLDNISIDSNLLEEHMLESDGSDSFILTDKDAISEDISMSGFKNVMSDQSPAESANEALGNESGMSPDAISAASQSIEENIKDLMSVVVFKIFGANCGIDIKGDNAAVCLQINRVIPNQLGNVSVRQYLGNRSMGSDHSSLLQHRKASPELRVRMERGPNTAAHSPLAANNGFLQCELDSFSADLLMSSIVNLGQFIEGESVSEVVPMKVTVSNTSINLKDDSRINPSGTQPAPIALHIENLLVQRNDDGSFSFGVDETSGPKKKMEVRSQSEISKVPEKQRNMSIVSQATQTLPERPCPPVQSPKKQEQASTKSSADLQKKQLIEENECLKQELSKAKLALAEAHMEKDRLLHQIKRMSSSS
ncbi:UHRF1-binding protein 1-like isoform X2 [Polyodon spathula]|uniref:UHRF1-binding protein 1-like isoform X2 n=1 Tax=Polyodon spathula TaxID=7913 RepID=UPI001B7F193E|nr:UHRF1-binding protein 1-like isoform X2 [Polyodon spathula]